MFFRYACLYIWSVIDDTQECEASEWAFNLWKRMEWSKGDYVVQTYTKQVPVLGYGKIHFRSILVISAHFPKTLTIAKASSIEQ